MRLSCLSQVPTPALQGFDGHGRTMGRASKFREKCGETMEFVDDMFLIGGGL